MASVSFGHLAAGPNDQHASNMSLASLLSEEEETVGTSRDSFATDRDDLSSLHFDDDDAFEEEVLLNDDDNENYHLASNNNELLEGLTEESSKSNMKMAFMNMANSIIGAGIIGQPYAIRQCGLLTGVIMLVVLTVVVDWTIRLIVVNAKLSGTNSYQATVSHCYGKVGRYTVLIAQGAFAFGGAMAFCVIIGDTFPHVLNSFFPNFHTIPVIGWLSKRNVLISLLTMGISYPLCLNRDISKLAKASGFALISMLVIVLIVLVRGPRMPEESKGKFSPSSLIINTGVFQGISVISFALVCHHNSLLIYGSLKKPTLNRFATVTHWSTGISMIICITIGVAGFTTFKDKTKGNLLNNFAADDIAVNIARLCFGLNMLTTFPLEIFVCRCVLEDLISPGHTFSTRNHFLITTLLVILAMSVSLFTCNLGIILELVGSSTACLMAYILPPLCYIKQVKNKKKWERIPSFACIGFGIMVMVISTVQSIQGLFTSNGEQDHCVV